MLTTYNTLKNLPNCRYHFYVMNAYLIHRFNRCAAETSVNILIDFSLVYYVLFIQLILKHMAVFSPMPAMDPYIWKSFQDRHYRCSDC